MCDTDLAQSVAEHERARRAEQREERRVARETKLQRDEALAAQQAAIARVQRSRPRIVELEWEPGVKCERCDTETYGPPIYEYRGRVLCRPCLKAARRPFGSDDE